MAAMGDTLYCTIIKKAIFMRAEFTKLGAASE